MFYFPNTHDFISWTKPNVCKERKLNEKKQQRHVQIPPLYWIFQSYHLSHASLLACAPKHLELERCILYHTAYNVTCSQCLCSHHHLYNFRDEWITKKMWSLYKQGLLQHISICSVDCFYSFLSYNKLLVMKLHKHLWNQPSAMPQTTIFLWLSAQLSWGISHVR